MCINNLTVKYYDEFVTDKFMKDNAQMETENTLHKALKLDFNMNITDKQFQYNNIIFNYYQTQLFYTIITLKTLRLLRNLKQCLPYKEIFTLTRISKFSIIQNTSELHLISDFIWLMSKFIQKFHRLQNIVPINI